MNLITIKCPGCGASLELNEERTTAYCSYCGRKLYVDDENAQDAAYEARQKKKREKLLEELDKISAAIAKENEISNKLCRARADLMTAQKKLSDLQSRRRHIPGIIIVVALIFILGVMASDSGTFLSIIKFLLICAASTGAYKLDDRHYKDKLLRHQQAVVQCSDIIDSVASELEAARKESGSLPLQEEYRNEEAIAYMRKVISAGRAQNLADAVLLYEEYLQRQQLQRQLDLQNEQLSLQNSQMRKQLERQSNQLNSQNAQLSSQRAQLSSQSEQLSSQNEQMADLKKAIDKANEEAAARDAEKKDNDTLGTLLALGGTLLVISKLLGKKD